MTLLNEYLTGLNSLLKALSQNTLEPEMLMDALTQFCVDQFEAAFARIWLVNEKEQILVLKSSKGIYTNLNGTRSRIRIGQGSKIDDMFVSGEPHISNNVANDPQVLDKNWVREVGLVSFAGYPLIWGKEKLGVLGMYSRSPLSDELLTVMETFAAITSGSIFQRNQYENNIIQFCKVSGLEPGLVRMMMQMED